MTLKDLKEQPLLEPPRGEQSPWKEIAPQHLRAIKPYLESLERDKKWDHLVFAAGSIKKITQGWEPSELTQWDLSVDDIVKRNEDVTRKEHDDQWEMDESHWMAMAVGMQRCGFDMKDQVAEKREDLEHEMKIQISDFSGWGSGLGIGTGLKEFGYDVDETIATQENRIRHELEQCKKRGDGGGMISWAKDLKNIGIDPTVDIMGYEAKMRAAPNAQAEQGEMFYVVAHIRDLMDLNLLTSNPNYDQQTSKPPLPQPKTWTK